LNLGNIEMTVEIDSESHFKNLKIMNVNARSLLPHIHSFTTKVEIIDPDVIVVTETRLDNTFLDSELQIHDYNIFRRDRNREGGGVLVATKKELNGRLNWSDTDHELLGVFIQVQNVGTVQVIGGYRPLDNADMGIIDRLYEVVRRSGEDTNTIIAGDLNLPKIDWEDRNTVDVFPKQKAVNNLMLLGFTQAVKEGTRDTHTGRCNLLDVVLVRPDDAVYYTEVMEGFSDHKIVVVEVNFTVNKQTQTEEGEYIYQYHRADRAAITETLEERYIDWSEEGQTTTVDKMWGNYLKICREITESFIPKKCKKKIRIPRTTIQESKV
jgi:predicted transcriptional regulator